MSAYSVSRWGVLNRVASTLLFSLLLTTPTVAANHNCKPPTVPSLPASIADENRANSLGTETQNFSTAGAGYLACLTAFAQDNQDTLSQDELSVLRDEYEAFLTIMRTHITQWNAVYGAFLESREAKRR